MANASSSGHVYDLVNLAVGKCLFSHDKSMQIRPKQLEAIVSLCNGKDTLCLLPTASGKSLIYQLLPSVYKEMGKSTNPILIIISPLVALMIDQVEEANSKTGLGLSAVRLEGSTSYNDVSSGAFNLIFGSPESWLCTKRWRDMLSSKLFTTNLVCIVVDEVHKVTW